MIRYVTFTSMVLAAGLIIAACGSASPGAGATGSAQQAFAKGSPIKFSECMRASGVPNFPDPSGGGIRIQQSQTSGSGSSMTVNGVPISAPAFQTAQTKCAKFMPTGGPVTASQIAKLKKGALAMARCMRSHGVPNFPDPQVTTGPGGHGIGIKIGVGTPGQAGGIDPSSPAFQAAQQACGSLLKIGREQAVPAP